MHTFCRASNLLAMIQTYIIPTKLRGLYEELKSLVSSKYSGSLVRENQATASESVWLVHPRTSTQTITPGELFLYSSKQKTKQFMFESTLLSTTFGEESLALIICSHLFHRAATYQPVTISSKGDMDQGKNTTIQYKAHQNTVTGRILAIVRATPFVDTNPVAVTDDVRVLVQRYSELHPEDARNDPYRRWPKLGSRLVYNDYLESVDVICVGDIISHVARTPWKGKTTFAKPCIIISSLDRVRALFILYCAIVDPIVVLGPKRDAQLCIASAVRQCMAFY